MTRPTKRQTLSYNVNFYTPYVVDAGTPDDSTLDEDTKLDLATIIKHYKVWK